MKSARVLTSLVFFVVLIAACRRPEPPIEPDRAVPAPVTSATPEERREETEVVRARGTLAMQADLPVRLVDECEPGQMMKCGTMPRPRGGDAEPLLAPCTKTPAGNYRYNRAACATPLVVAWGDAPVEFTRPPGSFAIGPYERTEWVSAATPFLALDRDGDGSIDRESELFRFDALAELDDDRDGVIDARDAAYSQLLLWFDRDQDRRSSPSELVHLADAGIDSLSLAAMQPSSRAFGSFEGERSRIRGGRLVDVYLWPM